MRAGQPITDFDDLRREMALDHFKWDTQVGDVDALGVPAVLRPLVARLAEDPTPGVGRIVRFDFHPTREGWRLSEANSDVPGGFCEASTFSARMAERCGKVVTGDPARTWLDTIAARRARVALLVSPGWLEDVQVVSYLAHGIRHRGLDARIVTPSQLCWVNGLAGDVSGPFDAVVRFHRIEWLADLPTSLGWSHFFVGGSTHVGNPGIAIASESKRFPIACEVAGANLPAWSRVLPETQDRDEMPDGDPHRTNANRADVAFCVDLPSFDALSVGLALLDEKFFPVLVFNGIPHPQAAVQLERTCSLLASVTDRRAEAALPERAPPAFILDASRSGKLDDLDEARFDNRSFVSESDFPSAQTLLHHGIRRIVVVHAGNVASDLSEVLVTLCEAGVAIEELTPLEPAPRPLILRRAGLVRRIIEYVRRHAFARRPDGGFGGPRAHAS